MVQRTPESLNLQDVVTLIQMGQQRVIKPDVEIKAIEEKRHLQRSIGAETEVLHDLLSTERPLKEKISLIKDSWKYILEYFKDLNLSSRSLTNGTTLS